MWYEVLDNTYFLVSLYEKVPELKDVRIAEINIHDEGRIVAIRFDMPYYADNPPMKWVELDHNTVHVRIDLSAVQEISIDSGSADFKANIEIFKDKDELIVVKITGTVNAVIKAESGFIQTITGFHC